MLNFSLQQSLLECIFRKIIIFKGSPDPSHFIFEINVGKSRIRHTISKLNDEFLDRVQID